MDKYVLEQLEQLHEICHRIQGYLDAKADLKENLRFATDNDEPKILLFPNAKNSEEEEKQEEFVEFTEKEMKQMPKHFQRIILVDRKRCRIRFREYGNTGTYEIRFRSQGYCVTACGKTKALAKENMLRKLVHAQPVREKTTVPYTFHSFATFYFENFRKETVTPKTFKTDLNRYQKHLQPYFKEKPLARILPSDCKKLLDKVEADQKYKTAEELYSILSCIFKSAIAHGIIQKNPLDTVLRVSYEQQSSLVLTREEETKLLEESREEPLYQTALALALYTGLRPNELETATLDDDFIVAINSKQKRKKNSKQRTVAYKRVYVCDRLRVFLKDGLPKLPPVQLIRRRMKAILPDHTLKDLRKTFNTRCKELDVSDHARKAFMGHSLGKIDKTYTDLSVAYLLKEGKKLNKW